MNNPKMEIEIMSDEEFFKMKEKQEKESFFNSLMSASESSTKKMGFSVKSMKGKSSDTKTEVSTEQSKGGLLDKSSPVFRKSEHSSGLFDDAKWTDFLNEMDEIGLNHSPIDDVTNYEIDNFAKRALEKLDDSLQEEDASTKYSKMFKKEIAMYSQILKEVNTQTRAVADKLKMIGQKQRNSPGVSKYYADMLEQFNSLSNTKMNAVKNMADLKAKAEDFRLKQVKAEGDQELGVDDLVDQYYKNVMNGGRADYMTRSFLAQSPLDEDQSTYQDIVDGNYEMPEGQQVARASWNITQPIPEHLRNSMDAEQTDADSYGYIQNEYRKPEICIQRFEDDSLRFIALDQEGLEVEGYELPGNDLLESMSIKPMSNFAYDKFGRKYSIIDISTSGADLSDLDDDDYQYGDNTD